jgi:hypothetical protein
VTPLQSPGCMNDIDVLARLTDDMLDFLNAPKAGIPGCANNEPVQASLFDRCINICRDAREMHENFITRSVHHLPCSGGTLITKCLAAMPNVVVLNEVDPLSTIDLDPAKPRFSPRDFGALLRMGDRSVSTETLVALFLSQLETLRYRTALEGRRLLLRDHSASHFLAVPDPGVRQSLHSILVSGGTTVSIVTVRNPIDSYLSMVSLDWLRFVPATFDEYCRRYLLFLEAHPTLPIFKYEHFVANPIKEMTSICRHLDLAFSDGFIDTFDVFSFSGDSGRTSNVIGPRLRRRFDTDYLEQARGSSTYRTLRERLHYPAFTGEQLDSEP